MGASEGVKRLAKVGWLEPRSGGTSAGAGVGCEWMGAGWDFFSDMRPYRDPYLPIYVPRRIAI